MKVPDRGLLLLQHYGVKVTDKEYIGIKLTDGLYDDANTAYLKSYNPDFNLRSNMAYILHQADMMRLTLSLMNGKETIVSRLIQKFQKQKTNKKR